MKRIATKYYLSVTYRRIKNKTIWFVGKSTVEIKYKTMPRKYKMARKGKLRYDLVFSIKTTATRKSKMKTIGNRLVQH